MSNLPKDYKKGIPGVPQAALNAIGDENTRVVLQSIIDGWNVRNGASGNGDSRFITAAELGEVRGQIGGISASLGSVIDATTGPSALTPGKINQIITDLQADVMNSVLFQELGTRITLINQDLLDGLAAEAIARGAAITNEATIRQTADTSLSSQITTLTASVNSNAAAIQTEATARANGDTAVTNYVNTQLSTVNGNISALQTQQTTTANNVSALSSTVTTLQTTVGSNTTAIQTEATARVNADNDIYSKYSVKIDTNGYVSGFGLISTANNSTPFSQFIIRADRFSIASPSGPGITPAVPFIVNTTSTTMADGTVIPAGVYMDYTMVKRLDGAYIYAGLLDAGKIYSGSVLVDRTSKYEMLTAANGSVLLSTANFTLNGDGTVTPQTVSDMRFYSSNWHYASTKRQRIRNTQGTGEKLPFIVNANATVDHFFSIWYRYNGSGSWIFGGSMTEPQSSDGSASVGIVLYLDMGPSEYIDFGVAPTNGAGYPLNSSKIYLLDLSVSVVAINI